MVHRDNLKLKGKENENEKNNDHYGADHCNSVQLCNKSGAGKT